MYLEMGFEKLELEVTEMRAALKVRDNLATARSHVYCRGNGKKCP